VASDRNQIQSTKSEARNPKQIRMANDRISKTPPITAENLAPPQPGVASKRGLLQVTLRGRRNHGMPCGQSGGMRWSPF
jgi:hypothetical protein